MSTGDSFVQRSKPMASQAPDMSLMESKIDVRDPGADRHPAWKIGTRAHCDSDGSTTSSPRTSPTSSPHSTHTSNSTPQSCGSGSCSGTPAGAASAPGGSGSFGPAPECMQTPALTARGPPLAVDEELEGAHPSAFFKGRPDKLFEEHAPTNLLGAGGDGAVAKVPFAGGVYALKRGTGMVRECFVQRSSINSPFVQKLIVFHYRCPDGNQYALFNLAAGDAQAGIVAHLRQMAKANSSAPPQPATASTGTSGARLLPSAADTNAIAKSSAPLKTLLTAPGWLPQRRGGNHKKIKHAAAPAPLSPLAARPLMAEMVAGVAAFHAAGMFHGDIKLENFLVALVTGHLKLADHSLSGKIKERPRGYTPGFEAPEVRRACPPPPPGSAWVDLLGALLSAVLPDCLLELIGDSDDDEEKDEDEEQKQARDSRRGDIFALGVTFLSAVCADGDGKVVLAALDAVRAGGPLRLPPSLVRGERFASLIAGMLEGDETKRYDIGQVKAHAFFEGVEWAALEAAGAPGRPPLLEALEAERAERDARAAAVRAARERRFAARAAAAARELAAKARAEVRGACADVKGAVKGACADVKGAVKGACADVKGAVKGACADVKGAVKGACADVKGAFKSACADVKAALRKIKSRKSGMI